jgi:hypothetical protein
MEQNLCPYHCNLNEIFYVFVWSVLKSTGHMVNRVWDGEIFDTFILLDIGAFDLELGIE